MQMPSAAYPMGYDVKSPQEVREQHLHLRSSIEPKSQGRSDESYQHFRAEPLSNAPPAIRPTPVPSSRSEWQARLMRHQASTRRPFLAHHDSPFRAATPLFDAPEKWSLQQSQPRPKRHHRQPPKLPSP